MSKLKERVKREFAQLPIQSKIRLYRQLYQGKPPLLLGAWEWGKAKLGKVEPLSRDLFVDYDSPCAFYGADSVVNLLINFDVVSFDLFDTVLLRKVDKPADIFRLMEQRLGFPGFARQRERSEWTARQEQHRLTGSWEVCFDQIYETLPNFTAAQKQQLQNTELAIEREQLMANPIMKFVMERLRAHGKRVIAVSDMYLDAITLKALVQGCGLPLPDELYVSSELGVSKSDGHLFERVCGLEHLQDRKLIHIGDNFYSDVWMGKNRVEKSLHYLRTEERTTGTAKPIKEC